MRSRQLRFLSKGQDLLVREQAEFCSAARLLHEAVVTRDEDRLAQARARRKMAGP